MLTTDLTLWKMSNGHSLATGRQIHFMYVRPQYSAIGHYITVDKYSGRLETYFARYGS